VAFILRFAIFLWKIGAQGDGNFKFFNDLVFLRGGLNKLFMESRDEKLSFGGGLNLPVSGTYFQVDYAYQAYERLGYVHKYTLRITI